MHRPVPQSWSGIRRQALTLEKPLGASLSAHKSPGLSSSLPPGDGVTWAVPPPSLSQVLFLLCFSLHDLITDSMSDNENSDLSDGYSACRRLDWNAQHLLHEAGHTPRLLSGRGAHWPDVGSGQQKPGSAQVTRPAPCLQDGLTHP